MGSHHQIQLDHSPGTNHTCFGITSQISTCRSDPYYPVAHHLSYRYAGMISLLLLDCIEKAVYTPEKVSMPSGFKVAAFSGILTGRW
jgi:hypothetical protein